jgi:hypothetical protein
MVPINKICFELANSESKKTFYFYGKPDDQNDLGLLGIRCQEFEEERKNGKLFYFNQDNR